MSASARAKAILQGIQEQTKLDILRLQQQVRQFFLQTTGKPGNWECLPQMQLDLERMSRVIYYIPPFIRTCPDPTIQRLLSKIDTAWQDYNELGQKLRFF